MTEFVADACALIVYYSSVGPGSMGAEARGAMAAGNLLVAAITVMELQRKVSIGKLDMPMPDGVVTDYPTFLADQGYVLAPFDWQDAAMAASLPDHHRDPWDRALIAIALRRNLAIITLDPVFRRYGVRTLW